MRQMEWRPLSLALHLKRTLAGEELCEGHWSTRRMVVHQVKWRSLVLALKVVEYRVTSKQVAKEVELNLPL
jgi:hypothetical protein